MRFSGPRSSGLGSTIQDILDSMAVREKIAKKHELRMAPYATEHFAVQAASQHAAIQADIQSDVAMAQLAQTGQVVDWVPWILGGTGVLVGGLFIIKMVLKRKRAK